MQMADDRRRSKMGELSKLFTTEDEGFEMRFRVTASELAESIRADGYLQVMEDPDYAELSDYVAEGKRFRALLSRLDAVGNARVGVVIRLSPEALVEHLDNTETFPADLKAMVLTEELVEDPASVLEFARRLLDYERGGSSEPTGATERPEWAQQNSRRRFEEALEMVSPAEVVASLFGSYDWDHLEDIVEMMQTRLANGGTEIV
jgi:hypothetical protein